MDYKSGMSTLIPLLSVKSLDEFTPQAYYDYIKSLYIEPEVSAPPADFRVSVNKKGTPIIRINRKPKFLTQAEVFVIARDLGWKYQTLWMHLLKKKIEIKRPHVKKSK